jgi:hypothetical protein
LYVYLSTATVAELSVTANQQAAFNKTIFMTEEMLTYLTSLLFKELPEEVEPLKDTKKVLSEMADLLFSAVEDILPAKSERSLFDKPLVLAYL